MRLPLAEVYEILGIPDPLRLWDGPGTMESPRGIFADLEEFVAIHHACGTLTGGADAPTLKGYRLWVTRSCVALFERWVTPEAAEQDLLRSSLLTSSN